MSIAFSAPAATGGRQRIGEEIGPRALAQHVDDRLRRGDEAAHAAAERLAERARDDLHARARAGQRGRAAPALAEMPVRMAVVDHDEGAVALGEVANFGKLRHVAVHGEDAVGGDQLEARAVSFRLLQLRFEIAHVGVGEAIALRLAETDAVDDRGVVQASEITASSAESSGSKTPPFASKQAAKRIASSLPSQRAIRSSSAGAASARHR